MAHPTTVNLLRDLARKVTAARQLGKDEKYAYFLSLAKQSVTRQLEDQLPLQGARVMQAFGVSGKKSHCKSATGNLGVLDIQHIVGMQICHQTCSSPPHVTHLHGGSSRQPIALKIWRAIGLADSSRPRAVVLAKKAARSKVLHVGPLHLLFG